MAGLRKLRRAEQPEATIADEAPVPGSTATEAMAPDSASVTPRANESAAAGDAPESRAAVPESSPVRTETFSARIETPPAETGVRIAAVLVAVGIFAADLQIPTGVAGGVPYVAVVLICLWSPARLDLIVAGVVCSALTIAAFFWSPAGGVTWMVVVNRGLALFAIWVTIFVGLQFKRTENSFRRREGEFRTLALNVPGLFSYVDADERFRYVNRRYVELFQSPASEIVGTSVRELIGDEEYEIARPHIQAVLSGAKVRYEADFVFPDGPHSMDVTYVPDLDEQGRVKGFFASLNDITRRKRAEEALRESEARLRSILQTAADAVITIRENGVIESVNPAAERMFGYAAEEMIGNNVKMLMPAPYREQHDDYIARYLRTGWPRIIGIGREIRALRKDGTVFPADLAVSRFYDQTEWRFTGVLRDITERKSLEREVLEIAAAEQRRIGQDLHDTTGQELTGLGLMAHALQKRLQEKSSPEAGMVNQIVEGLNRALAQVRNYAKGLVPVEVHSEGLATALQELAASIDTQQDIICRFECPEPVPVENNFAATHLYRIAQEAVTNALRHAEPGEIHINLTETDGAVTLTVRDDGAGIEHPDQADGLGLRIMRYRADVIGGRLSIEPAEGGGTVVTCTLTAMTEFNNRGGTEK